ncbi:uncharacterized protein METZ01_LOCUS471618, partial [marine metagenome]
FLQRGPPRRTANPRYRRPGRLPGRLLRPDTHPRPRQPRLARNRKTM